MDEMTAYYNEIESSAVLWLQAAIDEGIIPYGHIDTRSIEEVEAKDVEGFTQHHFFAGIGGWSIALRIAGWDDTRPVFTGSCPCQSFSTAGQGKGKDDERHLWPEWYRIIKKFRPATIFGEQVAAAVTYEWWDEVADDLEAEDYAVASAVLPAISVGRYHKRNRLWFVGDSTKQGLEERTSREVRKSGEKQRSERLCALGDTDSKRLQRKRGNCNTQRRERSDMGQAGLCNGTGVQWIDCPDGKQRPVEPSIRLLADGIPAKLRKAALHGYGNAIVPEVAAEFIKAYMDTEYGKKARL